MSRVAVLMLAGVLALVGCGDSEPPAEATDDVPESTDTPTLGTANPVLAAKEMNAYPQAGVGGVLTLKGGCLMLATHLVVLPAGTTWDEPTQSVSFVGDFAEASSVSVGSPWNGGGGYYEPAADASFLLDDDDAVSRLADCIAATKAAGVVFTYPSLEQ